MTRLTIPALVAALLLAGCQGKAESIGQAGNFDVERLFVHEGCSVYRFEDGGRNIYYAKCETGAETSWASHCGKNCSRFDTVQSANVQPVAPGDRP